MLKLKKGIRLECLKLPFKKALKSASLMGAEAVEINARTEVRPAELTRTGVRQIRKMLDDAQLKVCCVNFTTRRSYSESADLDARIDATKAAMQMAYDLGCSIVSNSIGRLPEPGSQGHAVLVQALEDLGRHSQRVGAVLATRTGADAAEKLRDLIQGLTPGCLAVDFDPAGLLIGEYEVEPAMNILGRFVQHFRARDAVVDLSQSRGMEVQLGRGSIDMLPLLAILEEHQYQGYITIDRHTDDDPVIQGAQSLEFLDNLFG